MSFPSLSISCLSGIFRLIFQTSFTFSLPWLASCLTAFSCHLLKDTTSSAGIFSLSSCLISLQHLALSISFSHFSKLSPFLFLFISTFLVLFLSYSSSLHLLSFSSPLNLCYPQEHRCKITLLPSAQFLPWKAHHLIYSKLVWVATLWKL